VNSVDGIRISDLIANLIRQISDSDWPHVNKVGLVCVFEIKRRIHGLPLPDLDCLNHGLGTQQGQIDMQQPVFHNRLSHFDAISEHEAALELARGDPAMQKDAVRSIILLPTSDHKLSILNGDGQILFPKTCHSQRYSIRAFGGLFDVEGRIALVAGFRSSFQQTL
jgi:hypothetical protein